MKTKLILVRNAMTLLEEKEKSVFSVLRSTDVSPKGLKQLAALFSDESDGKNYVKRNIFKSLNCSLIYSSDALNAVNTAKYFSSVYDLPVTVNSYLNELFGGEWDGINWNTIRKNWPEEFDLWQNNPSKLSIPQGESINEFKNRVLSTVRHIVNSNIEKEILIVTHQYVINLLLAYFKGVEFDAIRFNKYYKDVSTSIIEIEQGKFSVIVEGA